MGILKVRLTIISDIIPVILIAVASAYSIHVISRFNEEIAGPNDHEACLDLAARSLAGVITPVLMAAVTTMAGFISFVFGSYLTAIREFGIFSSAGILFAFIISVTFVPAVLSALPFEFRTKKHTKQLDLGKNHEVSTLSLIHI